MSNTDSRYANRLSGRVVLVTGAASGTGRACAELFAAEGAVVAVTDISLVGAEAVAETIRAAGGQGQAFTLDVSSTPSVEQAVGDVVADLGHVDVLVNCAGGSARVINRLSPFVESNEQTWDWVLGVNLKGPMICARAVLDHMIDQRWGRIINIGSVAGVVGLAGMADYSAAKAGLLGLTKALAMEVGPHNVTVNCVSLGLISSRPGGNGSGTYLGRMGEPTEVAQTLLHLASDAGAFITGTNIMVDGGRILGAKEITS